MNKSADYETVHTPDDTAGEPTYEETVQTLIDGSVRRNFDPYDDIQWDSPDYAIAPDDPRWILPGNIDLGKTAWYQNLLEEEQIRIGQRRMADVAKVGEQFERLLVQAINIGNMGQRSGSVNREYSDLEAREEINHIMMFEKLVDRLGVDTKGARTWFRKLLPLVVPAASLMPGGMWAVVLAGEEPIDHVQKEYLRGGDNMHPLMRDVMAIHVAEEGRHISYAHERLSEDVPKMSFASKATLAVGLPAAMRVLGDVIVKPSPEALADMNVPDEVADEMWGSKTQSARDSRRDMFPDARMLAEQIGLKTPEGEKKTLVSRIGDTAWRAFRVDGRSSRYRSEPNRTHVAA
jgi:hypothetical protein